MLLKSLAKILKVESGERVLVGLLFGQYFCTGIASAFTQTTAFTLFLTEFGAGLLPWTYIAMALIVSALTFLYLQAGRWLNFGGTLTLNLVAQLTITLGFAAGLAFSRPQWLIFALPVLFQIAVVFGNMAFWSLAGRILNVRQGKRLFGLVGAGEWLAIVMMGFLMPFIAPLVGLSNLLWLASFGMAGAALIMTITLRRFGHLLDVPATPVSAEARPVTTVRLWSNRYILSILALTVAWWVSFFFIDNIFYESASAQFPDETALAGFLGVYLGGLGVLTLFSNFVLSGRVIGRFGLRISLLILPVGLAIGAVIMSVAGLAGLPVLILFAAAVATKIWSVGAGFSVDQSARSILYQPLPPSLRTRVQTMADGVAQPVATGLAGVALLVLGAFYAEQSLPLILGLFGVVVVLVVLAIAVGRGYGRTLLEALDKRRLKGNELILTDAAAKVALHTALNSPQAGTVSYAIRMLTDADPEGLARALPELLTHSDTWVRRTALGSIASLHQTSAISTVWKMFADSDDTTEKAAAVRCLALLGDTSTVATHMISGPIVIRGAAIAGILLAGQSPETTAAGQQLTQLAHSSELADRVMTAQIIGNCHVPNTVDLMTRLLADDKLKVRRAALRAAGKLDNAALWQGVIACLDHPATRNAAASALVEGASTLPVLLALLGKPDLPTARARLFATICGRKRDAAAIKVLWPMVGSDDVGKRDATLTALRLCGFRATRDDAQIIQTAIKREAVWAVSIAATISDIGRTNEMTLVVDSLEAEITTCRRRIIALLSFIGDVSALAIAAEGLAGTALDRRAYALEVIDTQTPVALRSIIVPLFDATTSEQLLEKSGRSISYTRMDRTARLMALVADDTGETTSWTRACALYVANATGVADFATLLLNASQSADQRFNNVAAELMRKPTTDGGRPMLSTIEKVLILRAAGIFAETSGDILADVADVTQVIDQPAGSTVFEKDSLGVSMFVIASGQVGVYAGETMLNTLDAGEVFGEMALLDPEPRSATVRALEDVKLLQLDQDALFELIEMRPEVARGLLRVLTQRLRARMQDLAALQDPTQGAT
jgi:AAA family ATP:ADP antiporter